MAENPFAQFSLEKAIGLRWTLRDIQARRLKMSPVSDEDLTTLTGLGLVEVRDEGLVLTQAGIAVLNGAESARLQEALAGVARRAAIGQDVVVLVARLDHGQPHLCAAFHARHFYTGLKPRAGRCRSKRLQHFIPMSHERLKK